MVKLIPAAVGRLRICISAVATEGAIPVKIQAVGTGVGENTVQNYMNAQSPGLPAQLHKIRLGTQHGIWGFVIPGIIPVTGEGLGNGIQVQNRGPQGGNIRQLFRNTLEIAAKKVVVQHLAPVCGLPVDLFGPVLV